MGVMRRAGVWLGLVEDDDGYEDAGHGDPAAAGWAESSARDRMRARRRLREEEYADEEDGVELSRGLARDLDELPPASRNRLTERVVQRRVDREVPRERDNVRPITPDTPVSYLTHDNLALAPSVQPHERPVPAPPERRYQITTLHPTTYREARKIGEHFREGTPVIMNLTEMDEADARRLVDFGAGLAFGLRGKMERVTNRVFLLSPANVQVTAEDKAKIAEGGFFPQR